MGSYFLSTLLILAASGITATVHPGLPSPLLEKSFSALFFCSGTHFLHPYQASGVWAVSLEWQQTYPNLLYVIRLVCVCVFHSNNIFIKTYWRMYWSQSSLTNRLFCTFLPFWLLPFWNHLQMYHSVRDTISDFNKIVRRISKPALGFIPHLNCKKEQWLWRQKM